MVLTAWNKVAEARGIIPFTRTQFIALTRRPAQENFLNVYGEDHASARAEFDKAMHETPSLPNILPGALDLLDWLSGRQIPMGVVSNKQAMILRDEIAMLNWDRYFTVAVGSGDAAFDKPRPDPLLYALHVMDVRPGKQVWMIGDMESDIEAAHAAGVTAVLMETTAKMNLGIEGDLDAHKPDLRVSDARALMRLLQDKTSTISV